MQLTILGLGLMGGSVARALSTREPGRWRLTAWSRDPAGSARARDEGIVSAVAADPATAVRNADIVLLAAPPLVNLRLVREVGPLLAGGDATLSDVTSAQVAIGAEARSVTGLHWVGGHPMAGRERRGLGAATADLFVDRPWLIVPGDAARPVDVDRVRALATACGARPRVMDAATHDRLVAAISHLPLIVSAALAEAVTSSGDWPAASELAAGGWRDTTRVARGDPDLGAGIAALNRGQILEWLDRFEAVLAEWRTALAEGGGADPQTLAERFRAVRASLEEQRGGDAP